TTQHIEPSQPPCWYWFRSSSLNAVFIKPRFEHVVQCPAGGPVLIGVVQQRLQTSGPIWPGLGAVVHQLTHPPFGVAPFGWLRRELLERSLEVAQLVRWAMRLDERVSLPVLQVQIEHARRPIVLDRQWPD